MLNKLKLNLSERIDRQVKKTYQQYKRSKIKALDKEIANLVASEKALLRRLLPLQQRIEAKKQEKTALQKQLRTL